MIRMSDQPTQLCRGCGTDRPTCEFGKDARKKSGLRSRCRACEAEAAQARLADAETRAAYNAKRREYFKRGTAANDRRRQRDKLRAFERREQRELASLITYGPEGPPPRPRPPERSEAAVAFRMVHGLWPEDYERSKQEAIDAREAEHLARIGQVAAELWPPLGA